ncbi:hypothetical protein [Pseudomonas trivialis]|nr:hypothetical protein [Pseudomonas trivialis]
MTVFNLEPAERSSKIAHIALLHNEAKPAPHGTSNVLNLLARRIPAQ